MSLPWGWWHSRLSTDCPMEHLILWPAALWRLHTVDLGGLSVPEDCITVAFAYPGLGWAFLPWKLQHGWELGGCSCPAGGGTVEPSGTDPVELPYSLDGCSVVTMH